MFTTIDNLPTEYGDAMNVADPTRIPSLLARPSESVHAPGVPAPRFSRAQKLSLPRLTPLVRANIGS